MKNRLNVEELAVKRWPRYGTEREVCATTIREVAQPIADERDELREALEWTPNGDSKHFNTALLGMAVSVLREEGHMTLAAELDRMRENILATIAKYPIDK